MTSGCPLRTWIAMLAIMGGACTTNAPTTSTGSGGSAGQGSGGKLGQGGATGGGGMSSQGGGASSGGKIASGGSSVSSSTSLGGNAAAGGATASGGSIGSGGTTEPGSGTTSSGGSSGAGGSAAGGATSAGGSTGSAGSSGYPLGNPAVQSTGCGKALSTITSGTNNYKIASAGLDREYIVSVPSDYDQSKPYRLVFGMHCMGSSATQCANGDHYYRLQPLDTKKDTIFIALQGYTDGSPWRGMENKDDKDHVFFEDMVKLLESNLCIDKSRIFSVGFSFGAMFTNALAQTHQDILRGVVVYATADYNIYFPANTGKPLAYFGVHGTADPVCPFTSGKASKDRFVKNNGCSVPASVPEATSSTHVCYDYQCPSNYPVKWCTHDGQHTDQPTDPGQSSTWDLDLTWKFITQF